MTVQTLRCTNRAYDALLDIYGTDNAAWAAAYAMWKGYPSPRYELEHALAGLRHLCRTHRIDPDVE